MALFFTKNLYFRSKNSFMTSFFTHFVLSHAFDNTTSQNIRGTDTWAVHHIKFWEDRPPVPPMSPPMNLYHTYMYMYITGRRSTCKRRSTNARLHLHFPFEISLLHLLAYLHISAHATMHLHLRSLPGFVAHFLHISECVSHIHSTLCVSFALTRDLSA